MPSWGLLEFRETIDTLKNISKPIKEKIDHILGLVLV